VRLWRSRSLKKAAAKAKKKSGPSRQAGSDCLLRREAGIQAIATHRDLPAGAWHLRAFSRDHEYKRHGTLSLWPGSICSPARSPLVKTAIAAASLSIPQAFLMPLTAGYGDQAILDNHLGAHIQRNPNWLATQPPGRFAFTFTPKHGSCSTSSQASSPSRRQSCRHIRVASKQSSRTHHAATGCQSPPRRPHLVLKNS